MDINRQLPRVLTTCRDSIAVAQERLQNLHASRSSSSLNSDPSGMRRTPPGVFMPYDEDDVVSEGLFRKLVDAVNTTKDMAHVVWNVG
jgi:hypothetical protein